MGHGAGSSLGTRIHEGLSRVMPQGGKRPCGITDVLGHAAGQVRQQLQRRSCQKWLARNICQLGKSPACMIAIRVP